MDAVSQTLSRRAAQGRGIGRVFPILSILLHLGVALAAVLGPRLFERQRPVVRYVEVVAIPAADLDRGAKPVPKRTPAVKPPEPKPVEPEPEPPKPPPEDIPVLPEKKPEKKPPPKPVEPAPTAEPEEEASDATEVASEPEPAASLGKSKEADFAGFDDPEFSLRYSYYLDRLIAKIRREWRRPNVGEGVEMIISFRIVREGNQLTELAIDQSSGSRAFDRAGSQAVEQAVPLPPLPQAYRKDSLGVRIIFR
jgi:TonB family protein